MTAVRTRALAAVALAVALGASAAGGAGGDARDALEQAQAEMVRTARDYRASLEPLLALQEDTAARAAATAREHRALVDTGILSRREAEASEAAAAAAAEAVARTRAAMAEADTLVAEAEAERQLAALPPPQRGQTQETPTLQQHAGAREWSLAMVPVFSRLFSDRFGRPLPVSAFGQTALHSRLGFDHRNAVDVAVHPDTPEGRALMAWLRERGVSYLAFRGPVPGAATGAHIHIGEPSARLISMGTGLMGWGALEGPPKPPGAR